MNNVEHFKLMVEFMSDGELQKEFDRALAEKHDALAKIVSDELFERNINKK